MVGKYDYEVRIKWGNPGKGVTPSLTPRCRGRRYSVEKRALWWPSTTITIYIYIYIHSHTHTNEGCSKSFKPHPERRAKPEHFRCGNILSLLLKLRKTNLYFFLNFCAVEADTKVRCVRQILKFCWVSGLFEQPSLEMNAANRVQILDDSVRISQMSNAFFERYESNYSSSSNW